ncbi:MAG: anti-sigma factor antagonist [Candidatus Sumerlaeaceae bacterium]|nr:anti-sigma factor antagonist [Candidatus Sumerlaeaceae bacterium]
MEIEVYQQHSDLLVQPRGRIVLEHCERLKSACLPLITKGLDQVLLDLSKVDFVDSAGLGVLVSLKMAASKVKSRIILLQPSKPVSDILYISKLDGIFDILTGPEADLLKGQIMQPRNKLTPGAGGGLSRPSVASIPPAAPAAPPASPPVPPAQAQPAAPKPAVVQAAPEPPPPPPAEAVAPAVLAQREAVEEHCKRAVEHMRRAEYQESVTRYKMALELDPEYLPALNNLAIVYEKLPSWHSLAVETWETVLRISRERGDQKHVDRAQRHLENLRKMG